MTTPELLEFVRIEHALGMPLSEISRLLLIEGEWDPEDIAEAFLALGLPTEAISSTGAKEEAKPTEVEKQESASAAPAITAAPITTAEVKPAEFEVAPAVESIVMEAPTPVEVAKETPKEQPHFEMASALKEVTEVAEVVKPKLATLAVDANALFAMGGVIEPFSITEGVEPIIEQSQVVEVPAEAPVEVKPAEIVASQAEEVPSSEISPEPVQAPEALVSQVPEQSEKEKAEADAVAKEEEAAKASIAAEKEAADKEAREAAEAKARIEIEARMKAEEEARIRIEAEMKVRAELEAKKAVQQSAAQTIANFGVPAVGGAQPQPMVAAPPIVVQMAPMVAGPGYGPTSGKPAEPLTPMRATESPRVQAKPKPVEPPKPAPIKFDIARLRATDNKPGMPGTPSSMIGALAGMQPVSSMSPEEFFKAQTAGVEGVAGATGSDIARSIKVPRKRTMFGDLERMQQGTLPAQVSGSAVAINGDAATPVTLTSTAVPPEGALPVSAPDSSIGTVAVPVEAKSGSPWLMLVMALIFLILAGSLAGYYYFYYRLPASASILMQDAIASTMKSGQSVNYTLDFTANLTKEGGERLAASIKSTGMANGEGKGFGDSKHDLRIDVDHSGVSDPLAVHFQGQAEGIGDKYYLKSTGNSAASDALTKAAGQWVSGGVSDLGALLGFSSLGHSTIVNAPITTPSPFVDAIIERMPLREINGVLRDGVTPAYLPSNDYKVPIALDANKLVGLTDAISMILRGADASPTSADRSQVLIPRYGKISGYVLIDRKSHIIHEIDITAKYDAPDDVLGEIKGKILITPGLSTVKLTPPQVAADDVAPVPLDGAVPVVPAVQSPLAPTTTISTSTKTQN